MSTEVISRGEARHEVLQAIVPAADLPSAWHVGHSAIAGHLYARDLRDADALQVLAVEEVREVAPDGMRWPGKRSYSVTALAFWRSTEDVS